MFGGLLGLIGLSALAGVLVTATVTPAVAVTSSAATSAITLFDNLPSVLTIDKLSLPSTILYKDTKSGKWDTLAKFYDQNRSPVAWNQIAPVMYDAILSSEDSRYYEHGGVDLIGTTSAVLSNLKGQSSRGGSSISQQYVKNVLIQQCEWNTTGNSVDAANTCWQQAAGATGTNGIKRKIQEMRYAIALEQKYSKNEILLGYLNIALFGGTNYGVDAASKYYFGIPASKLNLSQAATLAGMVQNPNSYRIDMPSGSTVVNGKAANTAKDKIALVKNGDYYDMVDPATAPKDAVKITGYSVTKERQLYVLGRMLKNGKVTQAQYDAAAKAPIVPNITQPTVGCAASFAPYFCAYVRNTVLTDKAFGASPTDRGRQLQKGGLKIYTTLDPRVQKAAQKAQYKYNPSHLSYMHFGSTSVSVQASTGRVLAIAQNTHYSDTSNAGGHTGIIYAGDRANGESVGFNAGSTFKLFTLLTWLKEGHSVNEIVNGTHQSFYSWKDSCLPNGTLSDSSGYQPGNFKGETAQFGTPMFFTKVSLNSGFWGMAHELDLCQIGKTAASLGVTRGDDTPIPLSTDGTGKGSNTYPAPYEILGSDNVSPLAMASAYATVANKGVYCQPKVIDKVTDANGNPMAAPTRTCKRVLDAKIAATAAYALKGPMGPGGTGVNGNPNDGTELIGKTGTHQSYQTWLITSSTAVTTANWVGAVDGVNPDNPPRMDLNFYNGIELWNIRYPLARDIQGAIDQWYPGKSFPAPDTGLTKQSQKSVPNVIGMSQADAIQALLNAGFGYVISAPVDSGLPAGTIASQNPGPGMANAGMRITISPSNGKGSSSGGTGGKSPSPTPPGTGGGKHGGGGGGGGGNG